MKQYIVEVYIAGQKVKQFVTESYDIAQTIADYAADDITDARIKEVDTQ
jgi:hypothetical protein